LAFVAGIAEASACAAMLCGAAALAGFVLEAAESGTSERSRSVSNPLGAGSVLPEADALCAMADKGSETSNATAWLNTGPRSMAASEPA
jgi:hypothetical protein